jgi:hypothetical protein
MKRVKLDYSREITITDEAYEQIAAIAKANMVCEGCHKPYSDDNPNVELNRCLRCFLRYYEHKGLTFLKLHEIRQDGDAIYWFLDPQNTVHYTNSTSREPQQSDHYTLLYWNFPVPQTWQDDGVTKEIIHWHWSMYGNPKTDAVLLITNSLAYGSTRSVDFLTWKGTDKTLQIDRRKGEGRRLFLLAKKRIEATNDGHGYHMEDHTFYQMESYWQRYMVAKIANEEYRQSKEASTLS